MHYGRNRTRDLGRNAWRESPKKRKNTLEMYLFQELNIMELGFAKDKFIQFPTGQVPVGHESCGTVWTSPWQNQFHDIEFLEEAFSDITVLNFKV